MRSFWQRYRIMSALAIAAAQAMVVLITILSLMSGDIIAEFDIATGVMMLAVFSTAVGINILLFSQLGAPLRNLSTIIAKVSGEPVATPPQIPNTRYNQFIGIAPLMQAIYDIQSSANSKPESVDNTNIQSIIINTLNDSPIGLVIINPEHEIIFSNSQAPVRIDTDGSKTIDLVYDDSDTIPAWVEQCSQSAVNAEKVWKRIPNKPSGNEGRQVFDIYATYRKGRNGETVLAFLNRSGDYGVEDDSLDFMAFAAHEIRGPLTVIRGYLDVLDDELAGKLEGDQAILIDRLRVSAGQLSSYIKNILNTSRYDQRHLKMTLHEDSLLNAYKLISSDMAIRASSQNRLLAINIPEDLPTVAIDRASIGEVLQNLIDNAIKYSYEGGTVHVFAKQSDANSVQISVADSGIGIPSNVIKNLFAKFYRSHRSRDMVAGTGIGLYVAKAMVESHGGTISVKSAEGQGSLFTVTLPTYASVAEKLKSAHNSNEALIVKGNDRFIDNHSMYRG